MDKTNPTTDAPTIELPRFSFDWPLTTPGLHDACWFPPHDATDSAPRPTPTFAAVLLLMKAVGVRRISPATLPRLAHRVAFYERVCGPMRRRVVDGVTLGHYFTTDDLAQFTGLIVEDADHIDVTVFTYRVFRLFTKAHDTAELLRTMDADKRAHDMATAPATGHEKRLPVFVDHLDHITEPNPEAQS